MTNRFRDRIESGKHRVPSRDLRPDVPRPKHRRRASQRLQLETLEPRHLLSGMPELLADVTPGLAGSSINTFTEVGTEVFFAHQRNLWKSTGTPPSTAKLLTVTHNNLGEYAEILDLVNVNGILAFSVYDDKGTLENIADDVVQLWKSNGTVGGTVLVKDFGVGSRPSTAGDAQLTALGDRVFGVFRIPGTQSELWVSDLNQANPAGTFRLRAFNVDVMGSGPRDLLPFGEKVYFAADDGTRGTELWRSDGTSNGTVIVKDIKSLPAPAGNVGSFPRSLTAGNGVFFFGVLNIAYSTDRSDDQIELWKSDGTSGNTVRVYQFPKGASPPGGMYGDPQLTFVPETGKLFGIIEYNDGAGRSRDLVGWNGTAMQRWNLNVGGNDWVGNLSPVGGLLGFAADDGIHGREAWLTDGNLANPLGTFMIKDINPGVGSSIGSEQIEQGAFPVIDGLVYFPANDGMRGEELWQSDGTVGGTELVRDIYRGDGPSGPHSSAPSRLTGALDKLFFLANDGVYGEEPRVFDPNVPDELDFGDAPVPYPTLLDDNGARHIVEPGFHLGATIDVELDGQPNRYAMGDDNDGNQDDDGVFFVQSFHPGQSAQIQVVVTDTSGVGGTLDAWIDWDQDGDWADAGEQVFSSQPLGAGTNNLFIATPANATLGYTVARFRLSRTGGLPPTGLAQNGEVEDYMILVKDLDGMEFGDAPDPYPTYSGGIGAVHGRGDVGLYLGALIDWEYDGQPDARALGDDNNNLADEDGVELLTPLIPGSNVLFRVTASKAGSLNAWLDINADGDWDDPGEHFVVDQPLTPGANDLTRFLSADAIVTESTFARFRFSTQAGLDYRGWAPDGEVEDYEVSIQLPFQDTAGRAGGDGSWWVGESTGDQFASSPWGAWPTLLDWRDVRIGDFNGDGRVDLVGRYEGAWWVARSTGDGFVNEPWGLWSTAVTWEDVLVGDFNGDGRDDIAGRANGYWWLAKSTGTGFVNDRWDRWTTAAAWLDVQVADVDNDGRDDLVGRLNSTGDWTVARSTGTSFVSQTWGKWSAAITWTSVQVGDFNGDGRSDIAGRNSATGDWYVARSTGVGFVTEKWGVWSTSVAWKDIQVGDVSGDGRDDIVGRNGGDWWVARSTGTGFVSERWVAGTASANWQDVQIGDVNGDGKEDLVGRINGDWWLASSSGSSFSVSLWTPWPGSVEWVDVRLGDVNADGAVDILGRTEGTWWVARQSNGSVISEPWTQWPHVIVWEDVQAADVDGDGLDDIVGRKNGVWWVAKSTGSGFVTEPWGKWSTAVTWEDVLVGDFNGDGLADIAGRANGYWWLAKSTGTSFVNERWDRWTTAAPWLHVQVADVDGDGRDDLVGRLSSTGDWTVARSTGTSFVSQTWGKWSAAVSWTSVQVGDFNGDGRSDIGGRNSATGDWYVARSTGVGFVTEKWGVWSTSVAWKDIQVGDVSGDGRADIVGRNGGDWWVARSTGTGFVSERWAAGTTASTWENVQMADVNGDGAVDLVGRAGDVWWMARSTNTAFVVQPWGTWPTATTWQDVLVGNFSNRIPAALHAADLSAGDATPVPVATENAVQWLAEAAFARLTTVTLVDDSGESLPSITFQIADLPGTLLGQSLGHTILIDRDAAGFGWFVDLTPWDDAEFTGSAGGGDLVAVAGGAAAGRMDLLTVVMHELGHLLGYDHSDAGLMRPALEAGVRRLFDTHEPADDEGGLSVWDALLDDQSLDDAYFSALG